MNSIINAIASQIHAHIYTHTHTHTYLAKGKTENEQLKTVESASYKKKIPFKGIDLSKT